MTDCPQATAIGKPKQKAGMTGREMPHSLESEVALLGSILLRPTSIERVCDILRPGDFYRSAHRAIYESMLRLYNAKEVIDAVTLTLDLQNHGQLESIGGVEFLGQLGESVPTSHNIVSYANIIADKAMMRDLLETTWGIIDEGYKSLRPPKELLEEYQASLAEMEKGREPENNRIVPLHEAADIALDDALKARENKGADIAAKTDFYDLHRYMDFHRKDLIVLAADASMGKTSFLLDLLRSAAKKEQRASLIVTIETIKEKIALRMLSKETGYTVNELFRGQFDDEKVLQAKKNLSKMPIEIYDRSGISLEVIKLKTRQTKRKYKDLFFVAVDYTQLIRPDSSKAFSREQQVAFVVRGLKDLAKEEDVCVLALSQLNRDLSKLAARERRPRLAWLRESGEFELAAEKILLMWRVERYLEDFEITDKDRNTGEIIIAKNKDGMTGVFPVGFNPTTMTFYSLAVEDEGKRYPEQRDFFNDDNPL